MEIVKATPNDLIEVMYLLRVCIKDMNDKGLKHWNSSYPDGKLMRYLLEEGKIYMAKDLGVPKGMISISQQMPEDYKPLLNGDETKTLYLQFLAVHPIWRGRGIAKMLIEFAENFGKTNGFHNIKLDILSEDSVNQFMLKKNYSEIGKFHSTVQKIPYICYEKVLD